MMPSGGKTEGAAKNPGKKITPFGSFFSWCQTCRHGGHCDHMEGTFHILIFVSSIGNMEDGSVTAIWTHFQQHFSNFPEDESKKD